MKRFKFVFFLVAAVSALASLSLARGEDQSWSVLSPNGLIEMSLTLSGSGRVSYQVEYGTEGARTTMIRPSPMGLVLEGHDLSRNLRLDTAEPVHKVEEQYELLHGKRHLCRNQAQAITLKFKNEEGLSWRLRRVRIWTGSRFGIRFGQESLSVKPSNPR